MHPHTTSMPRNSARRGLRQILPALVLAFVVFLFSARPALAQAPSSEESILDKWLPVLGQVEVHLVYTDADGKQQDVSLAQAPPDLLAKLPLPLRVESKLPILNPTVSYFDGLWKLYQDGICKDTIPQIQQEFPPGSSHGTTAYDVTCKPFPIGFTSAYIVTKAPDYFIQVNGQGAQVIPPGGYPTNTVQQLQIEFTAPANRVSYTLTTPGNCTCHTANPTCNKDPDFTIPFYTTIIVRVNSTQQDSLVFSSNPMMQTGYIVDGNGTLMMSGEKYDVQAAATAAQLESSLEQSLSMLAMSDGASIFDFVAKLFEDIFKYGIGGLVEMTCITNIYNPVTGPLTAPDFNSATAQKMANQAHQAVKTLIVALNSAGDVGFSKLDVVEGKGNGLHFKLIDTPAKPTLQNDIAKADAATNPASRGIHLVTPTIGTGGQQLKPGVPFLVSGSNFGASSSNQLVVSWDRTLSVAGKSTLQWGPKGGAMQTVPLALLNNYSTPTFATPATLKPATAYQFRVQECDIIACSPWSDTLETSTESTTGGNVKLWLDNDTARPIGTGVPGLGGAFEAQATIPAGTAAGTHTINAAMSGNKVVASVQITVAGGSGVGATISVMNTMTHTAYTSPITLTYPNTFTLRGDGFAPSVMVTLHLDTATGPQLGTAAPNNVGSFQGNFQVPIQLGTHTLVAVQVADGRTVQATEEVTVEGPPK